MSGTFKSTGGGEEIEGGEAQKHGDCIGFRSIRELGKGCLLAGQKDSQPTEQWIYMHHT